ncbi:glycine/D-amino acid oxidase-like deaminating enzyme [Palleronia aestuarii]|uniref:Glycine/D-amino acid oxidase-like deaminating enzyme n=1 Tax=Palleronia aestuarii TaxID=568105 RepID=A0A2W7NAN8_9RHOB|nr:FAD-binding oxidoreductase [Palleronia aestuarii]PZX17060.1 glycine/D-amino acid oxidase-like deaminating enzyme [Palleronia aestuarii]
MKIVVIGAGMIGVSIAAGLARKGAEVVLVDRSAPGTGTTATSYAWVNANGKEPRAYFDLNRAGLEAHHRLSPEGDAGWLHRGGHVEIAVEEPHRTDLARRMEMHRERGYPAEEIDAEKARTLLPDVIVPDEARLIVHYPREAHAYPAAYLAALLGQAREAGAEIRTGPGQNVVGLRASEGGSEVTLADGTAIRADKVVSAAGRWTPALAALAGIDVPLHAFAEPGDITVGYLATTNPLPVRLTRLVTAPSLHIRPAGGGRLLLQALDLDATADPGAVPDTRSDLAATFVARLQRLVRNAEAARIDELVVGQRVMPRDGRTIAGPAPNLSWLYIVATHSGVTLAPYLGEAVAAELLGERQAELDDFRIERFLDETSYGTPHSPRRPAQQ